MAWALLPANLPNGQPSSSVLPTHFFRRHMHLAPTPLSLVIVSF